MNARTTALVMWSICFGVVLVAGFAREVVAGILGLSGMWFATGLWWGDYLHRPENSQ